jgi:tetratricopeptide (TPR) repeat protein
MLEPSVVVRDGSNEYTAPDLETVRQWRREGRIGPHATILDSKAGWVELGSVEVLQPRQSQRRNWGKTMLLLVVLIPVIGVGSCVAFGVGVVLFMGAKDARLKPQLPSRFAEADALAHAGKWSDAKAQYDDLVEDLTFTSLSSDRARAFSGKAICLLMLGQDDEAQRVFEQAFKLDPALPEPTSGAAVAPFAKLHSSVVQAAENEYLLGAQPAVAGAFQTTVALAQKVERTDLSALVAEHGAERVAAQLVKEVTRGRQVSDYYCSQYKPGVVPLRFRNADTQVKGGCDAVRLAYSHLIEATKAGDTEGVEKGWTSLNHATAQLNGALSTLTPMVEARGLDIAGVSSSLAVGVPQQATEKAEGETPKESWREYGRTEKYGRQIERETKAWRALIAENKPGLSAAEHESLIARQKEHTQRLKELRDADFKAWAAENQ